MPKLCVIALGSNLGDRVNNIRQALSILQRQPGISLEKRSFYYETKPVGYLAQPDFINAAAILKTRLTAASLLNCLQKIEIDLGRKSTFKWGPRLIDLDLIFIDDQVIQTDNLIVPHPRMHERSFVLDPLAEIAAAWVHPIIKLTVGELRKQLNLNSQ